ncbi:hypothetical protein R1sor_002150 [Riccia sorocarpa]|uniref:EF-hand domain-containing protein n=1 Tax=Riccia sorocarpa TaxID=122646 RepID=A0ABD3GYS8_9MARC
MFRFGVEVGKANGRQLLQVLKISPAHCASLSSNVSSCGGQGTVDEICSRFRWIPAVTASFGEREGAENIGSVTTALGLVAGVGLAALCVQEGFREPALCNVSEVFATSPVDHREFSTWTARYLLTDSFRRELFFKYERRIRLRSRPEKVFQYFASVRDSEGEAFMTPADLMRAVVPVFSPSESTRVREGYLQGERNPDADSFHLRCPSSEFFMLFDTNGDGLISFAEYIFFVTLLSIPQENFSTAFKMFDIDGNGVIDREEFKMVMTKMREGTRQGLAQRNGLRTGLRITTPVENAGLVDLFFGPDGNKLLRHEDFKKFLQELQEEIIRLEFSHYDVKGHGSIPAQDFALSMIAAADLSSLNEFLARVNLLSGIPRFRNMRISEEEFRQFAYLRKNLSSLALAISMFGEMNKKDFKRAATKVCHCPLSDSVVDVIFHIFDLNEDGKLSSEEFLKVMERREKDIGQPQATGILQLLSCWLKCPQGSKSSYLR